MMTLGDQQKRRMYDQLGSIARYSQSEQRGGGGGGGHPTRQYHYRQGGQEFQEEFANAEEFFQYMFFGHVPNRRR